ncbi:MAG: hypothetical protein CVU34_05440 [Betaproteobacteria bacterium HGW-Betaproteobacteria-7]|jgi:uncharacterized protein (UPF0333 family)|nr:MAG: hypothetical protein CVU34_05440 [Betaproteobacteria bacterium HGW-Betaproteobacteria-7]
MFAILIAVVLLLAGVAAIYLLVKRMSEEGVDMAAPGSCKRGRCGVPARPPVEEAQAAPEIAEDAAEAEKPKF